MKKFYLTLIFLFFLSINLINFKDGFSHPSPYSRRGAGGEVNNSSPNPSDKADYKNSYLKPLKLNEKTKLFKKECDLCGCYLGIDPNYNNNSFGIRFSSFVYSRDALTASSSASVNNDPTVALHPGHDSPSAIKETYNNVELYGKYYINPRTRIMFNIPYSLNTINGKRLNDVGDALVLAQYQVYNTDVDGDTKFRHRIFLGGGFKLPTGTYNRSIEAGILDPHIQAGTGSFDFNINAAYLAWLSGVGFNTDVFYTVNTKNSNDYKFANRINITSSLFYKIESGNFLSFLPHAGVYYEAAGNDKQSGVEIAQTESNAFLVTGGLDVYYSHFSLNFTYQHPVSQDYGGDDDHPKNDRRVFIGLGYSL